MSAGRRRNFVTIQQPSTTRNAQHEQVTSWVQLAQVWAAIEPLNGQEVFAAQQVNAQTNVKILLLPLTGLNTTCRVVHEGSTYEIDALLPPPRPGGDVTLMSHERL